MADFTEVNENLKNIFRKLDETEERLWYSRSYLSELRELTSENKELLGSILEQLTRQTELLEIIAGNTKRG
ncbi:hypothetical protein [Spirosoma radiotolerans]|uniref:Uncharacterized protein n=1 Tax=Spirosoma radiotolerans TaxID=1379870 RepID=A0A0E3V717_9BACT|nr:hypothetical protein [Spirosoma radiotolerans]AKD55046.1 hypothetical protein SD10_09145 [Spirosoma radiotolerans]